MPGRYNLLASFWITYQFETIGLYLPNKNRNQSESGVGVLGTTDVLLSSKYAIIGHLVAFAI